MTPQRKTLTPVLLGTILALLAGCQRMLPPPPALEHQGVVLRVGCPLHLAELLQTQSLPWQARQQAKVEIVGPDDAAADVVVFSPDALAATVVPAGGTGTHPAKLRPLPADWSKRGNPFDWTGLLPFYREQLLLWDRTAYAVPLVGEAPVCLFRADRFADPDLRARFRTWQQKRKLTGVIDLRAPITWEEFARLAEFFQDSDSRHASSLPPLPAAGRDLDRLFYTVAASYARRAVRQDEPAGVEHRDEVFSFHYDQKTGAPRIAGPGFVAALRMLQRLQTCRPARAQAHPEEAFLQGKAVLCLTNASTLLRVQQTQTLRDRVGVCVVPGSDRYFTTNGQEKTPKGGVNRVPYLGGAGWLAGVVAAAKHPDAAFDLLADLAGPTRGAQIAMEPHWGGGPTRIDQVTRERWDAFDLDGSRSLALKETLGRTLLQHGLKNPVLCLRTPDAGAQEEILVGCLRLALLTPGGNAEKELRSAAARWAEMNAKKGEKRSLADYRISLGLLGE